jgi:hypothetical protein
MAHESNKPTNPGSRDAAPGENGPKQEPRKRPKNGASEEMGLPEQNRKLGKRHD